MEWKMNIKQDINILCVDDYENIRILLIRDLKSAGFTGQIQTAIHGIDALEKLNQNHKDDQPFDFVISDCMMPEMKGLELLMAIRSNPNFKDLPVLMLTSDSDKETVMDCLKHGASSYLLKPWKKDELLDKLEICWKKHHKS